jgi:hypothetical protein
MRVAVILLTIMLLAQSCVRYSQGFDAYFCTSTEAEKKSFLYIDEKKIGVLPYVSYTPSANDESIYGKLLYTKLNSKRHRVKVLDENGNVLFSAKIKAGRNRNSSNVDVSVRNKRWNTKVRVNDHVLVTDLMY